MVLNFDNGRGVGRKRGRVGLRRGAAQPNLRDHGSSV